MMLLPGACVITFGKMLRDRKHEMAKVKTDLDAEQAFESQGKIRKSFTVCMYGREGRSIFAAMGIIFLIGLSVCFWAESQGNPALADVGLSLIHIWRTIFSFYCINGCLFPSVYPSQKNDDFSFLRLGYVWFLQYDPHCCHHLFCVCYTERIVDWMQKYCSSFNFLWQS